MSAEMGLLAAIVRVALEAGPEIAAAIEGLINGEPEVTVIARLRAARPVIEDTTAEDAARRARLAKALPTLSDLVRARQIAGSPSTGIENTAAILRLVEHAEGSIAGRSEPTRKVPA